jgi:hypothetical protein
MSTIFKKVVGYLQSYKPNVGVAKRGRPPKIVQDIDRTKVDEVIYDQKLDDGMRGKADGGKPIRGGRTDRQD